jgi:hypothetical protein
MPHGFDFLIAAVNIQFRERDSVLAAHIIERPVT